eukprot:3527675-Amphidinium_carterae.1
MAGRSLRGDWKESAAVAEPSPGDESRTLNAVSHQCQSLIFTEGHMHHMELSIYHGGVLAPNFLSNFGR